MQIKKHSRIVFATLVTGHIAMASVVWVACSKSSEPTQDAQPNAEQAPAATAPGQETTAAPLQGAATPTAQPAPGAEAGAVPAAGINAALNTPSTEPAMAKAQEIFRQRCVMCHGEDGTGRGPASANLQPKPRNYTDPTWQASIADPTIATIIVGGGDAVGKSMMMPANPDLKDQPEVVNGLVKIVRGFAPTK